MTTRRRQTLSQSFAAAASGIAQAARGRNFRIEAAIGALAIVLGFAFRISAAEWLAIAICIGCVLGGECANTALEALVDLASPEVNPLAKRAKDCMAGGVLICAVAAFAVACVIFIPKILSLIG